MLGLAVCPCGGPLCLAILPPRVFAMRVMLGMLVILVMWRQWGSLGLICFARRPNEPPSFLPFYRHVSSPCVASDGVLLMLVLRDGPFAVCFAQQWADCLERLRIGTDWTRVDSSDGSDSLDRLDRSGCLPLSPACPTVCSPPTVWKCWWRRNPSRARYLHGHACVCVSSRLMCKGGGPAAHRVHQVANLKHLGWAHQAEGPHWQGLDSRRTIGLWPTLRHLEVTQDGKGLQTV